MNGWRFAYPIQVRWRDTDPFGHVNNAVFASYLEIARVELWRERFGDGSSAGIPFFIARLEIELRRPIGLDDSPEIGIRAGKIKGASFTFDYRIEIGGELSATATTVQVCVDTATGKPRRMPPWLRSGLAELQQP
jgi:acyl-CoA thioester hydrolase